jgi:murein L,D-transpeptidase YafK
MTRKGCLTALFLFFWGSSVVLAEGAWLLIDTQKLQLQVKQGKKTLLVLNNIAIGRSGAGFKTHVGDDVTPKGQFKIGWINLKSPYHRFYGFDYPSKANANEGLVWGLIDRATHQRIISAHDEGDIPPQNTALGGQIGIHGLGKGDERIHKLMNWTHGCIALTNEQIDRLHPYIHKGTQVTVK